MFIIFFSYYRLPWVEEKSKRVCAASSHLAVDKTTSHKSKMQNRLTWMVRSCIERHDMKTCSFDDWALWVIKTGSNSHSCTQFVCRDEETTAHKDKNVGDWLTANNKISFLIINYIFLTRSLDKCTTIITKLLTLIVKNAWKELDLIGFLIGSSTKTQLNYVVNVGATWRVKKEK